MEITFLGTSSMTPTKDRNQSSVLITYEGEGILIDCGEGTQRQFKQKGISLTKITKILITHWHGDHVFGLPGIISTLGSSEYTKTLEIYGPLGTQQYFKSLLQSFIFDKRIELVIKEITECRFFENKKFYLEAYALEHNIPTLGYSFIEKDEKRIDIKKTKQLGIPEGPLLGQLQDGQSINFKGKQIKPEDATYIKKGRKISIIADTSPCKNAVDLARNADLLICESTYCTKLEEKGEEYNHMSSRQAGLIANQANAKKLILTHFSARYKTTDNLEEEAKVIFSNTEAAYDFMVIKL